MPNAWASDGTQWPARYVAGLDEQQFGEFTADKPQPGFLSSPRRQADGGIATHVEQAAVNQRPGRRVLHAPSFPRIGDTIIHLTTQNRIAQAFRVRFCVCSPSGVVAGGVVQQDGSTGPQSGLY